MLVMWHHMIDSQTERLVAQQFRLSAVYVLQGLFGLAVVVPSPVVSPHGYARTNVYPIRCSWSDGVLNYGQGTRLRCDKHSLHQASF